MKSVKLLIFALAIVAAAMYADNSQKSVQAHGLVIAPSFGGTEPIPTDPGQLPGLNCDQKPVPAGCPAVTKQKH